MLQTTLREPVLGLCRDCCRHPRQMRLVSAGAAATSSGRGTAAAGTVVDRRRIRIGNIDHQRGGAGGGEASRRFHACSPFRGVE